jgi:hypothetical protein
MGDDRKIRLFGLTRFDRRDLGEVEGIEYQDSPLAEGAHGEVAIFTAAVVMSALSAVAAYLLRKHGGQSFEEDFEEIYPDGRVVRRTIRYRAHNSQAPEADIIRLIRGDVF